MTSSARRVPSVRVRVRQGHAAAGTGTARANGTVLVTVLALGGLAFSVLQSMVAPALPVIGHHLRASPASTGWIVTSYLLTAAVATPIAGRMGDLWGRRRVLIAVLAILAAGCAAAHRLAGVSAAGRQQRRGLGLD
jgi:MFS family permease